jgi:soluble lytic murein transglycosylase-like protein
VQQPIVNITYVIIEAPKCEEEPEKVEPEIKYYDVPLSEELQEHIIKQCEERGIDPAIVLAMIKQESNFNIDAMGDYSYEECAATDEGALLVGTDISVADLDVYFEEGTYVRKVANAYGLMQIWPYWHSHRMDEYGCDDLRDPFQNVTVGIDIIADYIDKGYGVEWALMAYNGGGSYADKKLAAGEVSDYASKVMSYAESIKRGGA